MRRRTLGQEVDNQEGERQRWKHRLDLLIADFRDRGKLLRGSTTWEQAYHQAAINLKEAVEELAAPPRKEHPSVRQELSGDPREQRREAQGKRPKEEGAHAPTESAAWMIVAAFHDGVAKLSRESFIDLLIPLYRGDRHYVEGLWGQFNQHPWGFCRNRSPEEPGPALFAACLALGTDSSARREL